MPPLSYQISSNKDMKPGWQPNYSKIGRNRTMVQMMAQADPDMEDEPVITHYNTHKFDLLEFISEIKD